MSRCVALTAKGEQCRSAAMHGSDRCAAHLGRSHRPTKLDEHVADNLVVMLRAGNYLNVSVRAAGIGMATFRDWMKRGETSQRLADAPYRELRERVEKARAEGEVRMVTVIARAAQEGDWRAALVLLEREFPERWGPVSVRSRDETPPPEPDEVQISEEHPFREVIELAARRRTRDAG